MSPKASASPFSRRVLVGSLAVGVFLLCDIGLFGWLISRSLSKREVQRILLETREEAEGLAQQIAGEAERQGKDLYTAIALERETQTFIDSVLSQRDIVETVEIRDKQGGLVFRSIASRTYPTQPLTASQLPTGEVPPRVERKTSEYQTTFVEVPIGDLGSFVIGISPLELSRRLEVLRRDLMRQTLLIGALTLALLLSAYLFIWWLLRRGRQLEEQAKEAERMAYIGTLASGLAHEIRNPLNSLNLNMQLLEEEIQQNDSIRRSGRLLAITRAEISRLERLVTDFLSYARPRPPEIEPVSANELLSHTLEVLAGQIQAHGAQVRVEDLTGGAHVLADRQQMSQLLINLTQNALTATEKSGREARVRLAAYGDGERVVLEVEDNGVGIAAEQQERVFDLFFSTHKGGTGLGLAIVRRIARAHDADLGLRSRPGAGTAVSVSLPAAKAMPVRVADRGAPVRSLASG